MCQRAGEESSCISRDCGSKREHRARALPPQSTGREPCLHKAPGASPASTKHRARALPPQSTGREPCLHKAPGASPVAAAALGAAQARGLAPCGFLSAGLPPVAFWAALDIVRYAESSQFARRSRIRGPRITLAAEAHERPAGFPPPPHPSLKRRSARPCRLLGRRQLSDLDLLRKSRALPVRLRLRGPRNREAHHCVPGDFSRPSTSAVDFPGC
jgi:hypothetical protein